MYLETNKVIRMRFIIRPTPVLTPPPASVRTPRSYIDSQPLLVNGVGEVEHTTERTHGTGLPSSRVER